MKVLKSEYCFTLEYIIHISDASDVGHKTSLQTIPVW